MEQIRVHSCKTWQPVTFTYIRGGRSDGTRRRVGKRHCAGGEADLPLEILSNSVAMEGMLEAVVLAVGDVPAVAGGRRDEGDSKYE